MPRVQCGAGWAYAALGALESKLLINTANATGASLDLSEQQILVRQIGIFTLLCCASLGCALLHGKQESWTDAAGLELSVLWLKVSKAPAQGGSTAAHCTRSRRAGLVLHTGPAAAGNCQSCQYTFSLTAILLNFPCGRRTAWPPSWATT